LTSHHKIDVAVRAIPASCFANLPTLTPEELADKPFKLCGAKEAKIAVPLDKVAPIASLDLDA
jgi:hypothetical protein